MYYVINGYMNECMNFYYLYNYYKLYYSEQSISHVNLQVYTTQTIPWGAIYADYPMTNTERKHEGNKTYKTLYEFIDLQV